MEFERLYWVYILTNRPDGTLYIGMTGNLKRRIWDHRIGKGCSFTAKYNLTRLIFVEAFDRPETAFQRERQMKRWKRAWKIRLIEEHNPNWDDLYPNLT